MRLTNVMNLQLVPISISHEPTAFVKLLDSLASVTVDTNVMLQPTALAVLILMNVLMVKLHVMIILLVPTMMMATIATVVKKNPSKRYQYMQIH